MKILSDKAGRKSLGLTVYNNGFALVKELRSLEAVKGSDRLMIRDLPAKIEADSIHIKGVSVREKTFKTGRINREQLLEQHIGRLVVVRNMEFGEDMNIRLLAAKPDLIGEREESGEIVINPAGYLVLPPAEKSLETSPSISCSIEEEDLPSEFELSYLTAGITWEAKYAAELHGGKLFLEGWMSIENQTGADFENCDLKAVAGTVKRAGNHIAAMENELFRAEAFDGQSEQYRFADAYVYRFGMPFSISNGQTRQVKFMQVPPLEFQKIYRIEGSRSNAAVYLQFGGGAAKGLNIPLPQGAIKFYERDPEGDMEFIGEERIGHTPAKEKLLVKIGEAYDLTTKARERSRKKMDGHEYVTYEYQINNSKPENTGVLVEHMINDPIWEMESSTHDYEVMNSHTLEFHVRIGAGKTVEVEFTYKAESPVQPLVQ